MKMYFDYIKERQNLEGFRTDFGFVTFKVVENEFFIENMYVQKQDRGLGKVEILIDECLKIAKSKECAIITANIYLADSGANRTLRAALRLGFRLEASNNNVLLIKKEV